VPLELRVDSKGKIESTQSFTLSSNISAAADNHQQRSPQQVSTAGSSTSVQPSALLATHRHSCALHAVLLHMLLNAASIRTNPYAFSSDMWLQLLAEHTLMNHVLELV
jgi:hypothetical protein